MYFKKLAILLFVLFFTPVYSTLKSKPKPKERRRYSLEKMRQIRELRNLAHQTDFILALCRIREERFDKK
ncbi:MAG: hypothetical protein US13_C0001G0135 [candidate division TM6 bacterium GW2011_GWE2_36_25]|nr:MAG: hypothetical protein US03_C0001G0069 [candidate division TM6 bacterium GW2011_GWF2_36_131]KKQ03795.1 MAG: hypothetical protein US13_C0001G0135 [candidate division TM6 bacterium GW2011_GWE2_36_25]KKQ19941.1 MAG: hypothetical protein US32_C0003G0058 [candidate division TM6 bacterium GW2011_GWA2_36_9]